MTGTLTGTEPVGVVARCVGSHELLAAPATATTTLQALTGITPSMGALWLTVSVGRSFTSGNPVSGMHVPFAVPSTSATTLQTVAGAKTSASWPVCATVLGCCGQLAVLFPSISAMTSQTVTGTGASITPFCVTVPLVPVGLQLLEVCPTRPTFTGDAHRHVRVDGAVLRRRRRRLAGGQPERRRRVAEEADGVVLGGDRRADRPDGTKLVQADRSRRAAAEAPASRPTESEQTFIGAFTLASGDDCVVVLVPVVASCSGSGVRPISLARAVIGMEMREG